MPIELLIVFGVIALIAAVIGVAVWAERRRTAAWAAAAEALGLTFAAKGAAEIQNRFTDFRLFGIGHSRRWSNVITAETADTTLAIFDYRYKTGGGKHLANHQQTVFAMHSTKLQLPELALRPRMGFFDTIGALMGGQDIDFETHPAFSKACVLQATDEEAVRRCFGPELREFFAHRPKMSMQAKDQRFIYFRARRRIKPAEARAFLEEGYALYKALAGGDA